MKKNRIGIVGGGQLGRMITQEALPMGYSVTVIDPTPSSPAMQVGAKQIVAPYNDEAAIQQLAKQVDFLTFEIELANDKMLEALAKKGIQVHPSPQTLSIIKDKLKQKQFLRAARIPVADFMEIPSTTPSEVEGSAHNKHTETKQQILSAAKKFGYPLVLKARFDAYDGRGNALIKNDKHITRALKKLIGRKLYVEKYVPFVKELAIMVGRNTRGEIITYPLVETIHKNNICHIVTSPAAVSPTIQKKAKQLATKTMQQLQGAGMFGIEMFLTADGKVCINEIAPRVHNSGHYTIEGNTTSQFAQHVRAITGMPFGKTDLIHPAVVMINILGDREGKANPQGITQAENIPGVRVHLYGKLQTKPERKMGHLTAVGNTMQEALKKAKQARKMITI